MKILPLFDRVLILPQEEPSRKGGLALPSSASERPFYGKVVAAGKGDNVEGKKTEMQVKVGDMVIYSKYGGLELAIDKQNYVIMRQNDILAKVDTNETNS